MRKILFLSYLIALLSYYPANAQSPLINDPEYNTLGSDLATYITQFSDMDVADISIIQGLLTDKNQTIPRDYPRPFTNYSGYEGDEKLPVDIYIKTLVGLGKEQYIQSIEITAPDSALFCHQRDCWYAWVRKKIYYRDSSRQLKNTTTVSRLKYVKVNNSFKIAEIVLEPHAALPADADQDGIADYMLLGSAKITCDSCIKKAVGDRAVTPGGCPDNDWDGDGIVNREDHCPNCAGRKSKVPGRNGCPDPPSSRFGVSFSLSTASLLNSEFSDADISGNQATLKPGYFAKTGFTVSINANYDFTRRLGVGAGFMFTNVSLNTTELANTINAFLRNNGGTGNLLFSSNAKRLFIPNVSLRLGNFNSPNSVISGELIGGIAISSFSKNLRYGFGELPNLNQPEPNSPEMEISFKTSSFPVYGAKLNYEYGVQKDGRFRLMASLYYLRGNYKSEGTIYANGGILKFEPGALQVWGVSLGLHYSVFRPKILDRSGCIPKAS